MSKVILKNLVKSYDSKKNVIDNIDLEIKDGEFIVLVGSSGCGKSTILRLISGLENITEGKIYIGDKLVNNLHPKDRDIAFVFQSYALYPHMTVAQNIMFPLLNMRIPKEQAKEKALDAARLVQIEELMARKPSELSGGQQQRVAIARALVKMPNVLLLDEPLSNLDARLRLQTREEIRRIQRETHITTVFVTHDQEEAMSISDMIVVMKSGVVQQIGAPQEVYDDPKNLFVAKFLGTPPINVFNGKVESEKLYIGGEAVLDVKGAPDGEVMVGVRPEGFIIDDYGPFHCKLSSVEVMGRDVSIVSTNEASVNPIIRSIINADNKVDPATETVSYALKPHKVFIFNKETEERIYFEV